MILFSILLIFNGNVSKAAEEVAQSLTLDGRIYSDNLATVPLIDTVVMKIQFVDSSKTCVLYEETQNIDTRSTNGYYTIQVGEKLAGPKRTGGDSGNSLATVFSNVVTPIPGKLVSNGAACSYAPTFGDLRYLRIVMTPSSDSIARVTANPMVIDSVPSALVAERAESLQGFNAASFLKTTTFTTKGDLIVHDGTSSVRLGVGANNQVLTADSTAPAGVKWAASPSFSSSGGTISGAVTVSSGGISNTGGLDNNSGGITEAGIVSGVTSVTGTGAMTVASGGTNTNLTLSSNGTGTVNMTTGNGTGLSILNGPASTVNNVTIQGAATGQAPVISVAGSDTNIPLSIYGKGTGQVGILSLGYMNALANTSNDAFMNYNGGINNTGTTVGVVVNPYVNGTTAADTFFAFAANAPSVGTGSLANYSVFRAYDATARSGYTRGLDLDFSAGTDRFNVYAGGPAKNYFAGNVGIGTTDPQSKLHVHGTVTTIADALFNSYEPAWTGNETNPYLRKGWSAILGDYLYLGGTGNTANTNQTGIVLGRTTGFQVGNGSTNGDGLSSTWLTAIPSGVGIGITSPTSGLHVYKSSGITTGTSNVAADLVTIYSPATPPAVNTVVNGLDTWTTSGNTTDLSNATMNSANINLDFSTATTLGVGRGIFTNVNNSSTGTMQSALGIQSAVKNSSTGNIDSAKGFFTDILNPGGGTITDGFGLYIGTIQATNKFSIFATDATAPSYFAGNVGIGTNSPLTKLEVVDGSIGVRSGTVEPEIAIWAQNTHTSPGQLRLLASRGSGTASPQVNDVLGHITFGSVNDQSVAITAVASQNHAAGVASGGFLVFRTSSNTVSNLVERMRIEHDGKVGIGTATPQTTLQVEGVISPATNNSYSLGNASYRFTEVFAVNGVINTSDRREKKEIVDTNLGLDFINKLRPVSYRWKTGVDRDIHYGLIAQETEQAVTDARQDDQKTSIVTHDEKTDRYGVRYSELISPLIKSVQEIYQRLVGVERTLASLSEQKADHTTVEALKTKSEKLQSENEKLKVEIERQKQENTAIKSYLCSKDPKAGICRTHGP